MPDQFDLGILFTTLKCPVVLQASLGKVPLGSEFLWFVECHAALRVLTVQRLIIDSFANC